MELFSSVVYEPFFEAGPSHWPLKKLLKVRGVSSYFQADNFLIQGFIIQSQAFVLCAERHFCKFHVLAF